MAAWVFDFDGHTLIMDVDLDSEPIATWNIRIFERQHDDSFELHHESILELGVSLDKVRDALVPYFNIVVESDTRGSLANDESARALNSRSPDRLPPPTLKITTREPPARCGAVTPSRVEENDTCTR